MRGGGRGQSGEERKKRSKEKGKMRGEKRNGE